MFPLCDDAWVCPEREYWFVVLWCHPPLRFCRQGGDFAAKRAKKGGRHGGGEGGSASAISDGDGYENKY